MRNNKTDFSTKTIEARRQWKNICERLEDK